MNENLSNRGTTSNEITRYAEFVYFHPFIRRFLYGDPDSERAVLQIFKRTDVKKLHIVLGNGQALDFNVNRIHLYVFDIEIAILVLEISSQNFVILHEDAIFMIEATGSGIVFLPPYSPELKLS